MITSAIIPIGLAFVSGPPGESAYQLWLDNGNTGTLQQYLATLVGPMGPPGPQGLAGPVGSQGYTGLQGPPTYFSIGTVSNTAPGGQAAAQFTGPAGAQVLGLTLPQGATGPQGPIGNTGPTGPLAWQTPPSTWAASTAYTATPPASVVTYAGQTYVCTTAHASTSTFDATKFTLIAAKGADGSGQTNTVRYDINQGLTVAQQLQSRQNIGASGSGFVTYSAAATLTISQAGYRVVGTAGPYTITLPTVAVMGPSAGFEFIHAGTGAITFACPDSAVINTGTASAASVVLLPGQGATFRTDGTNWYVWLSAPVGTALLADRAQSFTTAQQTQLAANLGLQTTPAGQIAFYAQSTPPTGWLKANGASLSTTTYASLYGAIGTYYGSSGSGQFTVPDLRGYFLRVFDDGRGVDPGRGYGSGQGSQNLSHNHTVGGSGSIINSGGGGGAYIASGSYLNVAGMDYSGGGEARPINIALMACIKY